MCSHVASVGDFRNELASCWRPQRVAEAQQSAAQEQALTCPPRNGPPVMFVAEVFVVRGLGTVR